MAITGRQQTVLIPVQRDARPLAPLLPIQRDRRSASPVPAPRLRKRGLTVVASLLCWLAVVVGVAALARAL
ncbi:MAG: hypothetical protein ACTHMZ_05210 [Actinomycetes bacterium]